MHSQRTSMSLRLLFSLMTAVVMLVMVTSAGAGVTLTATKSDALVVDVDGDGLADPGDTLEYTVVITNNTAGVVNNVVFTDTLDVNTTFVTGSLVASPVAVNDTYPQTVIGNVSIDSSLVPYSVTSNDFLGLGPTATISAFDATSANGGQVSMITSGANLGQFTYNPPPGFEGTDTFTYSLNSSNGSNTATVSITVSGMVWFINNAASSCTTLAAGCGRLSDPFSTLAAFNTLNNGTGNNPAANDNIFVYESATQYTGAVTLLSGQKLIGQDATASLETITGLTRPSSSPAFPAMNSGNGTRTELGSTVTLNTNVTVRGLDINSTTSAGMNDPAGAITGVSVSDVSVSSTTATAVALSDVGGTFAFTSISSNGGTSNGISITNQSGSFTVNGDGSNTSVGGNSSGGTIQNKSGSDGSTSSGVGIYLNNVQNITLRRMTINGTNQNYGIRGNLVNGFALEYSTVGGANGTYYNSPPNNAGEGSIYFGDTNTNGLATSGTFTKNNISGGYARNMSIINTSAGTTALTIKGNTFGLNQNTALANQSLAVEARGSGTVINSTVGGTLAGEPNTFTGSPGDLVNFTGQTGSTMDVVFRNNALSNNHPGNVIGGGGMTLATQGAMTFHVTGNTFRDANGSAITLQKASGGTLFSGFVDNNTIGVDGMAGSGSKTGNGIFASYAGTGTASVTITNNTIRQINGNAHIYADNTGGSYAANFTIDHNTLDQPGTGWFAGIAITNGAPSSGDTINVCAKIGGASAAEKNTLNFNGGLGVIVGSSGSASGHTFNLPGYAGGANLTNVQSFIQGNNTGSFTTNAYADAPATAGAFTGAGTGCGTPTARLIPDSTRQLAQANVDASQSDRGPRQNVNENVGFNLPLDLPKWLKQTAIVNKDRQLTSSLPDLSAPFAPLSSFFAPSTAYATPPEMPNSALPDVTVNVGTLPVGKSITIKFRATINADLPLSVTQVSNQGTVTFDGGSEWTDDPAVGGSHDATITLIPKPDLTVAKTNDVSGSIPQGGTWKWKLTVQNSGKAAPLFASGQTILVDALPGADISYNAPTVSNFNGTGTINCAIAANTLTCTAGTAVAIPAETGKFDVAFTATPSAVGTFTNPTGGTCQVDPDGHVTESNEANNACNTDSVTVVAPPVIAKTFGSESVALNGTTALTLTLTNPTVNAVPLTSVAVTDTLPSGLQAASPPAASTTCNITFAPASGATTLNATGITLDPGSSCTLKLDVTGTTSGTKTNTTDAVTSANGGTGNTASAALYVAEPPQISKAFAAATKPVNESIALTFTITNTDSALTNTGVGFADNLPSGLQVASTPNSSNGCGGAFTTLLGSSAITLTNGTLAAGASCSLSVDVVGTTVGAKDNTTSNVTSNEGGTGNTASASITITQASTTATITGHAPSPSLFNQSVTFTATVTSTQGTPTGTATLNEGATVLATGTLNAGTVTFNLSNLSVGTHTVTATYQGNGSFAASTSPSVAHIVNPAPTTTTISGHTPNPSIYHQTVTFTVTVTSTQGSPSGTVTLQEGAVTLGTSTCNAGEATFLVSSLSAGVHTITATYQTDGSYASSTSPSIAHTVNKPNTATAISSSSPTTVFGQSVTFTATVTSSQGIPTGTATFFDGATSLGDGSLDGSGIATLTTGSLSVTGSPHTITARYNGDANFANSISASIPHNVSPASTTTALVASTTTPIYGQSVDLTATVAVSAPGAGTPSGSVTFYDGATVLGTSSLAGNSATFSTNTLTVNGGVAHNLTAVYAGDANFSASPASNAADVTVAPATLNVTAEDKTKTYGAPVPPLTVSYSGFVLGDDADVLSGAPLVWTPVSSSTATGNYAIGVGPGDLAAANYTFNWIDGTLIITAAPLTVTAADQSKPYGAPNPTLTASITGFVNGETAETALNGAPSLVTTALVNSPVGSYAINVTQGTLANINPLVPNYAFSFVDGTLTVNKDNTGATLSASTPNPSTYGQTVTFTATVTSSQGITPNGTVTFKDGATTLGTGTLNAGGVATFATSVLTVSGSPHSITATYGGSSNFNASAASAAVAQTVSKATTAMTLAAAPPNPSLMGQAVTVNFTVTVNLPGGGTPTGTVTVTDGTDSCSASAAAGSCLITFNSAGAKTLTATYGGDSNHTGSTSNSVTHTVTLGSCTPVGSQGHLSLRQQEPYRLFLPFVQSSQGTPMPDLIVQSIKPINNTLQIVLLNQGNAAVTDEFWVDLYVNPNPLPTKVNQIWQSLASQGAVWGVTAGALPALGANGTLTLSPGDGYYWPSLSNLSSTLPAGTCIYAQVDSANAATTYGGVLENHEVNGGMYNNITGMQLSGPVTLGSRASGQLRAAPSNRLPPRK